MSKTVTLRLTDQEYKVIAKTAKAERRPISNYITHTVVREIQSSYYADPVEMDGINKDRKLLDKLARGHKDAKKLAGKIVG